MTTRNLIKVMMAGAVSMLVGCKAPSAKQPGPAPGSTADVEVTTWGEAGNPSALLCGEVSVKVGGEVLWWGNQGFSIASDNHYSALWSRDPEWWGTDGSFVAGPRAFARRFAGPGRYPYTVTVTDPKGVDHVLRGVVKVTP